MSEKPLDLRIKPGDIDLSGISKFHKKVLLPQKEKPEKKKSLRLAAEEDDAPISAEGERFDKGNPYEVGRRMRTAFWNGTMEMCRRQRKSLHEVVADWLEEDPKGTFQMMASFFPKQIDTNVGGDLVSFLKEIEQNRRLPERVVSEQGPSLIESAAILAEKGEED